MWYSILSVDVSDENDPNDDDDDSDIILKIKYSWLQIYLECGCCYIHGR